MKKFVIAGNWKMNGTPELFNTVAKLVAAGSGCKTIKERGGDVVVCVPFHLLANAVASASGTGISVGAQDIHEHDSGAFTGSISGVMVSDVGASYTIVGHSERRRDFGETNEQVGRKVVAADRNGLVPIVCVGERLDEYDAGNSHAVVAAQIEEIVEASVVASLQKAIIAYEPIWAIGTGKAATADHAESVHTTIKQVLARHGITIPILYGGSVTAENAKELFAQPSIHGALIGGASLKPTEFVAIIDAAASSEG